MDVNAEAKVRKARAGLILDQPFFGALAIRLELVEDRRPGTTAWTDGKRIGYNPKYIDKLTLDEVKGLLCEEVMHVANLHNLRRGEREPRQWNEACDHAIIPLIKESGLKVPSDSLDNADFHDKSAEEIYSLLAKKGKPESQPGAEDSGEGGQEQGDGEGEGQGGGEGDNPKDDPSAAPGSSSGEVRDYPGKDGQPAGEAERREAEGDIKVALAQAITGAKSIGKVPAGMERLVQEMLNPKVDWRDVLRRFVSTTARNDYRWIPPSRRHVYNGLILPSLRSEELGDLVVGVDTSGSIYQEELDQFASELTAILEEYHANCTVIYCDTQVHVECVSWTDLPLKLAPKGGGGTDFRPPFEYAAREGLEPPCLVYFTDGLCFDFPEPPSYPVLWVVTKEGKDFKPPFGEVVLLH